jgi:pimeloyl-ACP methyl ester carboxylesterase
MEEFSIPVADLTFSALASGPADGDLVVLLHGFPQTSRAWTRQLRQLGSAGYRAVAPDMRGFSEGARPAGIESYELDEATADVLKMAEHLGASEFHLAGHDLGGIVAWELACRQPERIRTLAIASTPHLAAFAKALLDPGDARIPPFEFFRQPEPAPEEALLGNDAALLRAAYDGLEPEAVDHYVETFSDPATMTAALNYFRAFDFSRWLELPPAPVPTLFVWGADDPYLDPATAQATRQHVSGDYRGEELEGIGHWVPELVPESTSYLLTEHLAA